MYKIYTGPCDSKLLGIYLANSEASNIEETFLIEDIKCKATVFPHQNDLLIMPLLHGCH